MNLNSVRRLRRATLADGRLVDLTLVGETVGDVRAAAPGPLERGDLDLDGWLLLTAPADPHTHLDKALSWDAIRPVSGDLETAIS
ncbi:MAG: cytosine deaminase, partial [Microbacterium gubbeenense]